MSRERVASAILELIADDTAFKAGLGKAEGQAQSFSQKMGAVGKSVTKVGGAMAAFGGGHWHSEPQSYPPQT